MSGYVAMSRGWQDHGIFEGDEFSRRDAWAWLIANAAWKPSKTRIKGTTVTLDRGELCFSQRFLAQKWGWSKSRVDRFIAILRDEGMIETRSKIGATAGHQAGQGQSIVTICNYDKYQPSKADDRGNDDCEIGATAGQQRGKEEEGKKERKEDIDSGFAFSGRVIRLSKKDFDAWERAYRNVDLPAALQARDDWLANEAPDATRKNWFMPTSNYLANLNRKHRVPVRQHDEMELPC